jgi:hypothetical protein
MLERMKTAVLPVLLALTAFTVSASPITISVRGSWYNVLSGNNVDIEATIDSTAADRDSSSGLGNYELQSLTFSFTQLPDVSSPFTLTADPTKSSLFIAPASFASPESIVVISGLFGVNVPFPNGNLGQAYDLRFHNFPLANDSLASILGKQPSGRVSLFLSNQTGAYSDDFWASAVSISGATVPEPGSLSLAGAALLLLVMGARVKC